MLCCRVLRPLCSLLCSAASTKWNNIYNYNPENCFLSATTKSGMGCASSSELRALEQRVRTLEDRLQAPNDFTQERLVQAMSEKMVLRPTNY